MKTALTICSEDTSGALCIFKEIFFWVVGVELVFGKSFVQGNILLFLLVGILKQLIFNFLNGFLKRKQKHWKLTENCYELENNILSTKL